MCGTRSTTSSPSTTRTMRKTPWVAGCCGPMLGGDAWRVAEARRAQLVDDYKAVVLVVDAAVVAQSVVLRAFLGPPALRPAVGIGAGDDQDDGAHAGDSEEHA